MNKPHDPLRGNRRAQEKWLEMISELEDMGFTIIKGKSNWTFICRHGKVKLSTYRNMAAYLNGEWNGIITSAHVKERACIRGRQ